MKLLEKKQTKKSKRYEQYVGQFWLSLAFILVYACVVCCFKLAVIVIFSSRCWDPSLLLQYFADHDKFGLRRKYFCGFLAIFLFCFVSYGIAKSEPLFLGHSIHLFAVSTVHPVNIAQKVSVA